MTELSDVHAVAATNTAVEPKKLEQLMAIHRLLEKAGVLKKADYRLSPPLQDPRTRGLRARTTMHPAPKA